MEFKKVKQLKTFELQPFVLTIMENYSPVLKMLLPAYSKKLTKVVFDFLARTYLLMAITMSTQYKPAEVSDLAMKLKADKSVFKDLFTGQLNMKDVDDGCKYLEILETMCRDDASGIALLMYPLSVKLAGDFNDNCVVDCRSPRKQCSDCDLTSRKSTWSCSIISSI